MGSSKSSKFNALRMRHSKACKIYIVWLQIYKIPYFSRIVRLYKLLDCGALWESAFGD